MRKFKTFKDFIKYRPICPICEVPLTFGVISDLYYKSDRFNTTMVNNHLVMNEFHNPNMSINLDTNKITFNKIKDIVKQREFILDNNFLLEGKCSSPLCFTIKNAYYFRSSFLYLDEVNNKIYDAFIREERLNFRENNMKYSFSTFYNRRKTYLSYSQLQTDAQKPTLKIDVPFTDFVNFKNLDDFKSLIDVFLAFS